MKDRGIRSERRISAPGSLPPLPELTRGVLILPGYWIPAVRAAAVWGNRRSRATILMTESNYFDHRRFFPLEIVKGAWIRARFDGVFAGGASSADYMCYLGVASSKIWRGYDVVDNEHFARAASSVRTSASTNRLRLDLPQSYFLYVGRFAKEKNLEKLLLAYARYRSGAGTSPWSLVLVGDGEERDALRARERTLGLQGVKWVGYQPYDELPAYMALAGALILPSRREPWGLVVNEAMACGLPVIVSARCGCIYDLVWPGENGCVVDPNNPSDMSDALLLIASDRVDRVEMGAASERIIASYSPETWSRALCDCVIRTRERRANRR